MTTIGIDTTAASDDGTSSTVTPAKAPTATLERISLKIPPFWTDEPALWFAQVESQFILAGVTLDNTKYNHVVAYLDYKLAQLVRDVISNPPATDRFETLKTELIRRLSSSQEKKIQQLLEREELGDRKPSEFLRHLQALADGALPENFLRTLWLGRLPTHMQAILTTSQLPLDGISDLADKLHELTPATRIAPVHSTADSYSLQKQIEVLQEQVANLTKLVQSERPRRRRQSKSPAPRPSSSGSQRLCWYHHRFGDKAAKCTPPCSFSGNGKQSR